jgi:hypothetical protein
MMDWKFEGKHFSVDYERAKKLSGDYPVITGREWLRLFLTKIDEYCTDNTDKYARRKDGTLKSPSAVIRNWLDKETDRVSSIPRQTPHKEIGPLDDFKRLERHKREHPEEYAGPEDYKELSNRLNGIG